MKLLQHEKSRKIEEKKEKIKDNQKLAKEFFGEPLIEYTHGADANQTPLGKNINAPSRDFKTPFDED